MKLYLIRHGDAIPSNMDPQRPLSVVGQTQVRHLAQHLVEQNAKPTTIYHSGILRAEQTAHILAQNLHVTHVKKIIGLLPEDPVEIIADQVMTWMQDTILVSHLPYIAYLLEALCITTYSVQFDTATAVCLLREKNTWLMETVLHP